MTQDTIDANYRDPDIDRLKEAVEKKRDELNDLPVRSNGVWVDARFGDQWIHNAVEHYSKEDIAHIAVVNGRNLIILREQVELAKTQDQPQPAEPSLTESYTFNRELKIDPKTGERYMDFAAEPRLTAEEIIVSQTGLTKEHFTGNLLKYLIISCGQFSKQEMFFAINEKDKEISELKRMEKINYDLMVSGEKRGVDKATKEWKDKIRYLIAEYKTLPYEKYIDKMLDVEKLESLLK